MNAMQCNQQNHDECKAALYSDIVYIKLKHTVAFEQEQYTRINIRT